MLKLIDKTITQTEIRLLAKWRKKVQPLWGETFKVTFKGTRKWIHGIVGRKDKALFFVIKDGIHIGHVGFDELNMRYCFIGNIIRGSGKSDGSMTRAIKVLIKIAYPRKIYVRLLPYSKDIVSFYRKIGFKQWKQEGNYLIMKYEKN